MSVLLESMEMNSDSAFLESLLPGLWTLEKNKEVKVGHVEPINLQIISEKIPLTFYR